MFPPDDMKFSISGFKILEIIALEQYFIQLLQTDVRYWICFYSFEEYEVMETKQKGTETKKVIVKKSRFKCEKCFRLPTFVKIIPQS
jgi:hypothetical protein